MESKLEIFFGKFAIYIIGVLVLAIATTSIGWYVSTYRYQAAVEHSEKVETQLEVSNASYGSIRDQFALLTKTLEANQDKALASHALLQEKLSGIIASDKAQVIVEGELLSRTPQGQCVTPKDLADAYDKL